MRAVGFFPEERAVRVVDHPRPPRPRETEVRVKILDVGVCGTDREIARGEYGAGPPGSPYLVLGHESLGEIVEVGTKVTGIRAGDLAVTMVRRPCGDPVCPACAVGRPDFCVTGKFTERGDRGGGSGRAQRRWPAQLAGLVTGRSPPEACRDVLLGARSGIKQVITFAA